MTDLNRNENTGSITEQNAVLTLVFGLVSVFLIPFLGIAAVIIGYKSLNNIKRNPYLGGYGMAQAGFILGWVAIGFSVIIVLATIFFFMVAYSGSVTPIEPYPHRPCNIC